MNDHSSKKNAKQNSLEWLESPSKTKDFVTIFPKNKTVLSPYGPSFLPPIRQGAIDKLDRLEVIHENAKTFIKGDKEHRDGVHMVSAL